MNPPAKTGITRTFLLEVILGTLTLLAVFPIVLGAGISFAMTVVKAVKSTDVHWASLLPTMVLAMYVAAGAIGLGCLVRYLWKREKFRLLAFALALLLDASVADLWLTFWRLTHLS